MGNSNKQNIKKNKKESEITKEYLNDFKKENSPAFKRISDLIETSPTQPVLLALLTAYIDYSEYFPNSKKIEIKRLHKRNADCCWKLIDSIWLDFDNFLSNIVFEHENNNFKGDQKNIEKVKQQTIQ